MSFVTPVILVTHGRAGEDMLYAAQSFLEMRIPRLTSVHVEPKDTDNVIGKKIDAALASLNITNKKEVLFLVDLVGSTPARMCGCTCEEQGHVVTGINLAMLLKLTTADRSQGPIALGRDLATTGAKSIHQE